jgi:hypothetical protein
VEDFGGASVWGWKDPRTCLTLPFWQYLLPPVNYVICLRHPLSVARSLERRNSDFSLERGVYLWLAYLESVLACTVGEQRTFVVYEDLMDDWLQVLQCLCSFLGEAAQARQEEIQEAVEDFIRKDLQHHPPPVECAADQSKSGVASAIRLAREAYLSLKERRNLQPGELEQKLREALELMVPEMRRQKRLKTKSIKRRDIVTEELAARIPHGDTFILVDENQSGIEIDGRPCLPFPDRHGRYCDLPEDDDKAIRDFERWRQSGASFVAFAWPAFWWLDYYAGLHRHLRSKYPCVLNNERVVVFDLRNIQFEQRLQKSSP